MVYLQWYSLEEENRTTYNQNLLPCMIEHTRQGEGGEGSFPNEISRFHLFYSKATDSSYKYVRNLLRKTPAKSELQTLIILRQPFSMIL